MNNSKIALFIMFSLIFSVSFNTINVQGSNDQRGYVLIWMGLEVVGENPQQSLEQLKIHKNSINAVSYEAYYLGSQGTFSKRTSVTDVTEDLRLLGVELWPMITSTNLTRMRILFSNPDMFISAAVKTAVERNFTGYNVDFEPEGATNNDAYNYVSFLNKFADALHTVNKKLSVDIATWSVFWNYDILAQSKVDMIIEMSTYAGRYETFYSNLNYAISKIPKNKLLVGLETLNPNTGETIPFSESEVEVRIRSIIRSGLNRIAIWRTPLPEYWWPLLDDVKNGYNIVLKPSSTQPIIGSNITITAIISGGISPFTYTWKINNRTTDCTTSMCNIIVNNTNPYIITLTTMDSLYINSTATLIITPTTRTTQQSITSIITQTTQETPTSSQTTFTMNLAFIIILSILILLALIIILYRRR